MNTDQELTIAQEIDEFFSYTEMSRHLDNQKTFQEVAEDWDNSTPSEQKAIITIWLESLKSSDRIRRYRSCQCLLYFAQGEFGNCTTPSEHLQRLITNNLLLYHLGAFETYYQALRSACLTHDNVASAVLAQKSTNLVSSMNDLNFEIGLLLSLSYLLVEVCRFNVEKRKFASDIVELEPPLMPFLFGLIAKLKEKSFKGYPTKKVLLLLWKVLIGATCDFRFFKQLKDYQRKLFNLAPRPKPGKPKVEPEEFNIFNLELNKRFPSCSSEFGNHYFSTPSIGLRWALNNKRIPPDNPSKSATSMLLDSSNIDAYPFLMPLAKGRSTIPTPIREAAELYKKHLYFPLHFTQLLHTSIHMFNLLHDPETRLPPNMTLPDDILHDNHTYENSSDNEIQACLNRIEILYSQLLPESYAIVVVLLKLLLATIPAPRSKEELDQPDSSRPPNFSSRSNPFDKGDDTVPPFDTPMHLSVDEVDDIRHKEIVSKASSSIILHLLKMFKISHAAKFEYYSLMLVDSNAILLILKLYGLQDFSTLARVRNECDHLCFFKALLRPKPQNSVKSNDSDTSSPKLQLPFPRGRTMFTALNFFRVLHMLTKEKISRLLLLVQFRSTVIFKRALRISHPTLTKYIHKVLRNQVSYLGRKWRQNNMKLITSIYLKCNQGLSEEWVLPANLECFSEIQNGAIRDLVTFYNEAEYPEFEFHRVQQNSQKSPSREITNKHLKNIPMRPTRSHSFTAHMPNPDAPPKTAPRKNSLHYSKSVNSLSFLNNLTHQSSNSPAVLDLDDDFMNNYEDWLEQEVYNQPDNEMFGSIDWKDRRAMSPDLDENLRDLAIDEAEDLESQDPSHESSLSSGSASPPLSP